MWPFPSSFVSSPWPAEDLDASERSNHRNTHTKIMTRRQHNSSLACDEEGSSSLLTAVPGSPYVLHQDDAEQQRRRQPQHSNTSGDSFTASATPSPFDYSEFSRYVVSSTPGNMTPNGRHRGSFSSATASLSSSQSLSGRFDKKREVLAWTFVVAQSCIIAFLSLRSHVGGAGSGAPSQQELYKQMTQMNDKPVAYYQDRRASVASGSVPNGGVNPTDGTPNPAGFYDEPILHPLSDPALAERKWRSAGSPYVNSDLKRGTCWCSADEWCMCTPSLAIDVVLTSGENHVWLVRRADTNMLALMGGMNEVGETVEDAVHRELAEEMSITLPPSNRPVLFGVYNDPMRDARRHSASAVYVVDVPEGLQPTAGDDATSVVRLPLSEVQNHEFFVDHKTILRDYIKARRRASTGQGPLPADGDGEPFRRSVCPMV